MKFGQQLQCQIKCFMNKFNILLFFFLLIPTAFFAQRIGIEATYNADLLAQSQKVAFAGEKKSLLNGVNAGFRFEFFFAKDTSAISQLSINFGPEFKFLANRYLNLFEEYTTTYRELYYLMLPIDLSYYIPLNKKRDFRFFVFGGPRITIGLVGKYSEHYFAATRTYETVDPFKSKDMQRVDVAIGVGCGIDYRGMFMKIGYDIPCMNTNIQSSPKYLYQHQLQVTMGYILDLDLLKKRNRKFRPSARPTFQLQPGRPIQSMDQGGFIRR